MREKTSTARELFSGVSSNETPTPKTQQTIPTFLVYVLLNTLLSPIFKEQNDRHYIIRRIVVNVYHCRLVPLDTVYSTVMNKLLSVTALFLGLPVVSHAQTFQVFLINLVDFLGNVFVPFLLGIAFLFFTINVIRFFVLGGSNEEGKQKAKALATYSVLGIVIIVIFWGVINMLSSSIGLNNCNPVDSDYVKKDFTGPPPPNCI